MYKISNWLFGSFFRTIGRILVYILLALILSYFLKDLKLPKIDLFQVLDVSAESINVSDTADGYILIDGTTFNYNIFYNTANSDITFRIMTATALSESYNYSFMFTDICSPHDIWAYRTSGVGESCSNSCWSNEVLIEKTDYLCSSGGFQGNIYRLSTPIKKWERDENDEMAYVDDRLSIGTSWSATNPLTLYGVYFSNESNLGKYEVDYTETINNINSSISNGSQSIINSQNQNKNDIINNQNSNTQDIIDNQNANSQAQIDSQKVCNKYDKNNILDDGKYLKNDGTYGSNSNFGITDFIKIDGATIIPNSIINNVAAHYCFYNVNKSVISCFASNTMVINQNITIPNNATYFRFTISKSDNKPQLEICKNGNQATADKLDDMNNSINNSDSSQATNDASNFFSNFTTDTHGLTGIITAPLNAINSLTNQSCSPLVLPLPFLNQDLSLPCMRDIYDEYFGSFMTLYDVISLGIVSYWVMVRIFSLVKDFKNPEHDEIEVLDL